MGEINVYVSDKYKRKKRRRRRIVLSLFLIFAYLLILLSVYIVFNSGIFRIKHININGNKEVSGKDIKDLIYMRMGSNSFFGKSLGIDNMLSFPNEVGGKSLVFLPEVKYIKISKDYKTMSVDIYVEERSPFGIWCFKEGKCFWFDKDGVLFKSSFAVEGGIIPVVYDYSRKNLSLGSRILPKELMPNLIGVFSVLKNSGVDVKKIILNDVNLREVEVSTYNGPDLYFSLNFMPDNAYYVISKMVKENDFDKIKYIDFRIENRAYYK